MTCNLACVLTLIIGTIGLTEPTFQPTQLIWINLIMDILGAIAFAFTPPLASVIHQKATSEKKNVLTKTVWRQIYGVSAWIVAIMSLEIFFGRSFYDLYYEKDTQTTDRCPLDSATGQRPNDCQEKQYAENKHAHMTIVFCSFVFL